MKVRILSDLHIEFGSKVPALDFGHDDVVVLAGDIHVGDAGVVWAQKVFPDNRVLYVMGNHEYYRGDFNRTLADAKARAHGSNVAVLENDVAVIDGVRFLGCSLWTDFEVFGMDRRERCMHAAAQTMNDFRLIQVRGRPLTPSDTIERCRESHAWLTRELTNSAAPTVVVTHHAPTQDTNHPHYADQLSNAAFANNFAGLIQPHVRLWVHGHSHHCADVRVGETRIVSNQLGYPGERTGAFDWGFYVEIR